MRHQTINLFIGSLVLVLSGCGSEFGATVSGSITLDGESLPQDAIGTVVFFPQKGGPPATGRILDGSQYTLTTGRGKGLFPGEYSVTVGANEPSGVTRGENGGPPPAGKQITPRRYRQSRTSGLVYTVEPGSNNIDIELSSNEA